ncbi:MAG: sigma-70 family RNA polymerase sigma factor [Bryobacteraceae bacterium]
MPFRIPGAAILPVWRAPSTTAASSGSDRLEQEVVDLFDRFRDPLLRYLLSCGLPVVDAEDIIQEVFISLFQHLERGKSRENLRGWLYRVAHNLASKRRYRARRESQVLAHADAADAAVDPGPGPEAQLVILRKRKILLAVVDALPEQDRRCLFLRAEGLRYREIAGILDMSLGAVSLSLTRSLARIGRAAER